MISKKLVVVDVPLVHEPKLVLCECFVILEGFEVQELHLQSVLHKLYPELCLLIIDDDESGEMVIALFLELLLFGKDINGLLFCELRNEVLFWRLPN